MRIITRPDLDGLTSAVLLKQVEPVEEVLFVEPQELVNGQVTVGPGDIIANLPFHPACGLWFDHHASNAPRPEQVFKGAWALDPSAARTIYNHYRDARLAPYEALLLATDKVDSAQLELQDVLKPEGYVLLALTLDSRTNLGGDPRPYVQSLVGWLEHLSIEAILAEPEVKWRTDRILAEQAAFEQALRAHSWLDRGVVVTDFRGLEPQPVGSRFLVYALFPEAISSVRLYPALKEPGKTALSVAHNLFKRVSSASCGALCARFGGGGHKGAGSCAVPPEEADAALEVLIRALEAGIREAALER